MAKLILVLCALFAAVLGGNLTEDDRHKILIMHNECVKETGVDRSLVAKALTGNFSDDPKFKAQLFCILNKIGFLNEAGNVLADNMKEKLSLVIGDESKIEQVAATCGEKKENPEQTAVAMMKCFYEEKKKLKQ